MRLHENGIREFARIKFVIVLSLVALFGLAVCVTLTPHARADENSLAAGEHIITVYDGDVERGFITKKQNLREALVEAGLVFDDNDRTEPNLDTELTANSYHVNIYRARTVVIRDGAHSIKLVTSYRTARQIVDQAGISVRDEDDLQLSQSDNPIRDGAPEVLNITRATEFTTTVEEDIPFEIEQVKDANRDKNYKEVKTAGEKGRRTVTYEVKIENGVEVSRREISSHVTKEPVKQVEIIGTKVSLPAGSHEDWMAAAGISASDYGYVNYIFTRESGWRTTASNGIYYGLGQTNLAKLSSACPNWESDPVCQTRLFNSYAVGRYGSWAAAYDFWTKNHWW